MSCRTTRQRWPTSRVGMGLRSFACTSCNELKHSDTEFVARFSSHDAQLFSSGHEARQ
jgi:hypothetical protein